MQLKLWVKISLGMMSLLTVVALISLLRNGSKAFSNVVIKIEESSAANLISEDRIRGIIDSQGIQQTAEGKLLNANLEDIERRIEAEAGFVANCEVSRDLKGNLVVKVIPNQPIARILAAESKGGYIGKEGEYLPLSDKYTPRVVLLMGKGIEQIYDKDGKLTNKVGKPLYKFLQYIEQDAFWKAQITEIDLDESANANLYVQIGSQEIELGRLEGFERKLEKLKLFYSQIIPAKGWNKYKKVKLGFDNQIVCE